MTEPQQPLQVQLVKKAWYKRWYGILFIIVLLLIFIGVITSSGDEEEPSPTFSPAAQRGEEAPAEQAPAAQEEKMLQKFEGDNAHTTRPFTVPDKWEARWNMTGTGNHSITLYRRDGEYEDLLLNDLGKPVQGSKFIPKGGDYYLEIGAREPWTLEVWQVP